MISVSGLSKTYGMQTVFNDLNFSIKKGDIIAIIGPSGTGKSSLLRCLNYLEVPTSGSITIDDLTVDSEHYTKQQVLKLRQYTSFVFQNFALFKNKTAVQNIMESLLVVKKMPFVEAEKKAMSILAEVGLADKHDVYPAMLSGGQQQRVGIGRALATESKVMLLDEPTSALDPEIVADILTLLRQLAEKEMTMMVVTHELRFAKQLASEVWFMSDGELVEQGTPHELFSSPKDPRTQRFLEHLGA
ncbi:amino acid ABC transporter ATP-binding protein [Zooshikella harenae]|uniref:Amino acid ABC transporter ATP-binding protein n=1 Tax=Zooshikella harenae TaxID=2827238 RepID=A0ABS5ZBH9_9GAMM|nr:amino acid ABC transporter ATP-binding protein [Zooshikella harenae]MBU2711416.1 amino acid ABC transporter ATP-binding protein [Zooshikella harenae]